MDCPNPACKPRPSTFTAQVQWKERKKELPWLLPVRLNCAHCKREVRVWAINSDLRELAGRLDVVVRGMRELDSEFQDIKVGVLDLPRSRPLLQRIRDSFKKET